MIMKQLLLFSLCLTVAGLARLQGQCMRAPEHCKPSRYADEVSAAALAAADESVEVRFDAVTGEANYVRRAVDKTTGQIEYIELAFDPAQGIFLAANTQQEKSSNNKAQSSHCDKAPEMPRDSSTTNRTRRPRPSTRVKLVRF